MTLNDLGEDRMLGIKHAHEWQPVTALPALQSAHDVMRWDVSKTRIVSIDVCTVCGEHGRESILECGVEDCPTHRICSRPYR